MLVVRPTQCLLTVPPTAVVDALGLIKQRIKESGIGIAADFNEVLTAAYMEEQKMAVRLPTFVSTPDIDALSTVPQRCRAWSRAKRGVSFLRSRRLYAFPSSCSICSTRDAWCK